MACVLSLFVFREMKMDFTSEKSCVNNCCESAGILDLAGLAVADFSFCMGMSFCGLGGLTA